MASNEELNNAKKLTDELKKHKQLLDDLNSSQRETVFLSRNYTEEIKLSTKAIFENNIQAASATKAFKNISNIASDITAEIANIVDGSYSLANVNKQINKLYEAKKRLLVEEGQALDKIAAVIKERTGDELDVNNILGDTVGLQDVMLKYSRDLTGEERKLLDLYVEQHLLLQDQEKDLEKIEQRAKNIEGAMKPLGAKSLGLADIGGGLEKGLNKAGLGNIANKLGIEDAIKGSRQFASEITEGGTKTATMGQKFKVVGNLVQGLGKNLMASLGPIALIAIAVDQIVQAFIRVDKGTGDLAKSFNVSYTEANKMRGDLDAMANSSGDIALNTERLQQSLVAVGGSLGSNASLNEKDLKTFTKLRDQAGFTNEQLVEMQKLTLATGGNLEDNTKELLHSAKTTALNNGVLLNEKELMKEISTTSKAVMLSVGGTGKELGKAAAQAKAVGMNLAQVDKIAGSLLNFEESISAEIEAELMTGKQLNLEKARQAALDGNLTVLSAELAKNVGTSAEFTKMNRLQQEALAKSMGMSREELAESLVNAEALKGLSGEQAENAKKALDAARARGMSEEEIKQKGIDGLMQQQSMQEKMAQTIEKIQGLFSALITPLMPIFDILMDIVTDTLEPIIQSLQPIFGLLARIGAILKPIFQIFMIIQTQAIKPILGFLEPIFDLFDGIGKLLSGDIKGGIIDIGMSIIGFIVRPFQFVLDIITGVINTITRIASLIPGIDIPELDLDITDGLKSLTGLAEGGVVTGPTKALIGEGGEPEMVLPLSKAQDMGFGGNNGGGGNVDMTSLIQEIQEMKKIMAELLKKEGTVTMDGATVGKVLALGSSKLG